MNSEARELLKDFYDSYRDSFESRKRIGSKSILTSSLDVKNTVRFGSLRESALSAHKVDPSALSELLGLGLVRQSDEVSKYVITASGIWVVETESLLIDEAKLIEFLDTKYFKLFRPPAKGISEKEKIIIMTLISARAFSAESRADLQKDENTRDTWKKIVEETYEMLKSLGVISETERDELFRKKNSSGTEHPVSQLIRHSDKLPPKTRDIFKVIKPQKYYLDLYDGHRFSPDGLAYLFWLIFRGEVDPSGFDDILKFCNHISYDYSKYISQYPVHPFSNPEYDAILREALKNSVKPGDYWA
jgi:hypothetical protein